MIDNISMTSGFRLDSQNQSAQRFDKADSDGNGELSQAEFSSILSDRGVSETNAEKLFTKLDKDNSGAISTEERELAVDQMQQRAQKLQTMLASGFNQSFDSVDSLMDRLQEEDSIEKSDMLKQRILDIRENLAGRGSVSNDLSVFNYLFPEINETV